MHNHTTPPRRATAGALLVAGAVLALPITIVLAWLGWQFERLDEPTRDAIRKAIFILPLTLASGGAVYLGVLGWKWLGVSDSIANWFGVLKMMAEKRQGARATTLHYEVNTTATTQPVLEGEVVDIPALPSPIPTFAELLSSGKVGPNAPMLLGFDAATGEAISGSWKDLFSCSLGGLQGSGKTWAAVYLLAQSALQGGRLVICDPHAGDEESLAVRMAPLQNAMLCDIAEDDKAILAALKMADDKLQRRKHGHKARWPIVVAIDEFLSLRRGPLADLLPPLIEDFSTEGRKLNCHVLLLSQRWDKAAIGDFRNTLSSSYVFRIRPDEARMMTGLRAAALPDDTLSLPPGQAYMLDTRGRLRRVVIPQMTPGDVGRVAAMLDQVERPALPIGFRTPSAYTSAITAEVNGKAIGSETAEYNSSASQSRGNISAEALLAADLFRQNLSEMDIAERLGKPSGGRNFAKVRNEIRALILEGMINGHH